jgi:plastocyanin
VKAREYSFVLSRPAVAAGEVTIELNNQGEDPHNLNLERESGGGVPLQIPDTSSQGRQVAHLVLPAGAYRLWCSLPEHDEKGMHARLIVE